MDAVQINFAKKSVLAKLIVILQFLRFCVDSYVFQSLMEEGVCAKQRPANPTIFFIWCLRSCVFIGIWMNIFVKRVTSVSLHFVCTASLSKSVFLMSVHRH